MIANLILKNNDYYCSNCMMRQSQIRTQCSFCGDSFSNWENVQFEIYKEKEKEEIKNEENLRRKN